MNYLLVSLVFVIFILIAISVYYYFKCQDTLYILSLRNIEIARKNKAIKHYENLFLECCEADKKI